MHAKRMQVTCIVLKREILGNKKKKDSKRTEKESKRTEATQHQQQIQMSQYESTTLKERNNEMKE